MAAWHSSTAPISLRTRRSRRSIWNRSERAGVLTHPYLMASFAYTASSSPIHRGVFIARSVLGRVLRPPPEAVAPLAPDLHPDLTTRQRVTLQTKAESCQSCHGMINPLGFTLEHFDAVGRYRNEEKGRPIDATGSYETRAGEMVKFDGSPRSRDVPGRQRGDAYRLRPAVVPLIWSNSRSVPMAPRTLPDLRRFFAAHDFNLRKLMVEIMATSALTSARGEAVNC